MTIGSNVAKDWWSSYSKIRRNIIRIIASLTTPFEFHVRCRVSQSGNWYTGLVRIIIYDSCAIHILNRWVRTSIEGIQYNIQKECYYFTQRKMSNMRLFDTSEPLFEELAIFKLSRALSLELFFHSAIRYKSSVSA